MGNKGKKASLMIVAVIVAVFTLFGATYGLWQRFGSSEMVVYAATDSTQTGKTKFNIRQSSKGATSGFNVNFDEGTYMIIYHGAAGSNFEQGDALPAYSINYFKGSSLTVTASDRLSLGATSFFAEPSWRKDDETFASGAYANGAPVPFSMSSGGYPLFTSDSWASYPNSFYSFHNGLSRADFYRIDPINSPSDVEVDSGETAIPEIPELGKNRYTPTTAIRDWLSGVYYPGFYAGISVDWVYSIDGENWYLDPNRVALSTIGTQTVYCRYVLYADGRTTEVGPTYNMLCDNPSDAAKNSNYTITSKTITLKVGGQADVAVNPTAKSGLKYNGGFQSLINAGTAENGTMQYRLENSDKWYDNADDITARDIGTYTVYYRALGDGVNYTNSPESSLTVSIGQGDANFDAGDLSGRSLTYTGGQLQLFTGAAAGNGGTVYYAYSLSSTTAPYATNTGGFSDIGSVTAVDACDGSGVQYTYYLWYRRDANANYSAVAWMYANVNTKIEKANYTVSVAQNNDVNYDGLAHNIFAGNPTVVSTAPESNVFVKYQLTYQGNNNVTVSSEETTDASTLNSATDAGIYTLTATWTPTGDNAMQVNGGSGTIATFEIKKAGSAAGVKVIGLNATTSLTIGESGSVQPFNQDQSIDLVIGLNDLSRYNGITTNNDNGYNKLSYAFTTGTPTDDDFATCATAYDLNSAVKGLTARSVGTWYLYFNVTAHNSLADDVRFVAATIVVAGFDAAQVPLGGVVMTGALEAAKNGSAVYNGSEYSVVSSGNTQLTSTNTNLKFGTVFYALSDTLSTIPGADDWVASPSGFKKKDVGTYYLWVKWGADADCNVTATAGRVYASFQITKLSLANAGVIYFAGLDLNVDEFKEEVPESDRAAGLDTYARTYDNTNHQVVAGIQATGIKAYSHNGAIASDVDIAEDFGTFTIGVSSSLETMTGSYYGLNNDNYKNLKVCDVGMYYIWITWPGSTNVEAGAMLYQIDAERTKPRFYVKQLTESAAVGLKDTFVRDTNPDGHPFQYTFSGSTCDSVAQALFEVITEPALRIGGVDYIGTSITYQYLLTASTTVDASTDVVWVNSVELATQDYIGEYYLWVKINIDNINVKITRYIQLNDTAAKIVAATSFSNIPPTATKENLTTDVTTFVQLINVSAQKHPPIEYSLGEAYLKLKAAIAEDYEKYKDNPTERRYQYTPKDLENDEKKCNVTYDENGWAWTTNVKAFALSAINADAYVVYYRGAEYKDDNNVTIFEAEVMTKDQYSCIYVIVNLSETSIPATGMPVAVSNVYYTGQPIGSEQLFSDGYAQVGENTGRIDLVYRWDWDGDTTKKFYAYGAEELQKTNAGTYVLYFKPTGDDYSNVMYIMVQIKKVDVEITGPVIEGASGLIYKAAEYYIISSAADYGLKAKIDGKDVTYSYSDYHESKEYGTMGAIRYGISTGDKIEPTTWYEKYEDVCIQQVGTYFVWVKVDAGDNHNAHAAQCFSSVGIKVNAARAEDIRLINTTYTVQLDNGEHFRYNGLSHSMLTGINWGVEVLNRDDNGRPAKNADGKDYNLMPDSDLGTIYYALTMSEEAPEATDMTSEGWHTSWQTLSKTDAGTYRLHIMFVASKDSNITSPYIICLSTLDTANGDPRPEIRIDKATKDDLTLSGILGRSEMYTGGALSINQLTAGNLVVTITSSRFNVTDKINLDEFEYFFWNVTKAKESEPNGYNWTSLANTTAEDAGKYQLYVRLNVSTDNIDTNGYLIYKLLVNPVTLLVDDDYYAEIRRADEYSLDINAPTFVDLNYNGTEQRLIVKAASIVKMQNGNALKGIRGDEYYYISDSATETPNSNKDGWYHDFSSVDTKLKRKAVGTYYIWIRFDEGDNYTAVAPRYVGSVTITKTTEQGIVLSGMQLLKGANYNGSAYQLVLSGIKQRFKVEDGEGELLEQGEDKDYIAIYYAYSNDPHIAPSDDDDVWKIESSENLLPNLQAINAGKYYIWIKVKGTNNVDDYYKCYDLDYAEIVPAALDKYCFQGINSHTGLSYIGKNQILADLTDDKLSIVIEDVDVNAEQYNNNLVISWGLGSADARGLKSPYAPAANKWTSSLNDVDVMGINAGTYYLWIRVTGSDNIEDYAACYAQIVIDKAIIHVKSAPGAYDDLIYTGDYQSLLTGEPVFQFRTKTGGYYKTIEYYDAVGVAIRYNLGSAVLMNGYDDYRAIKGLDAKAQYDVYYGVLASDNWDEISFAIPVRIAPRDASSPIFGLAEAPAAKLSLEYNEGPQDLISFGRLSELPMRDGKPRGAALEGSKIEFWYVNENGEPISDTYRYSYQNGAYVWDNEKSLETRTDAGTYYIRYRVTGTGNYQTSDATDILIIEIAPRRIWWETKPEAIYGLKYNNRDQTAITKGELNVKNPQGVTVKYTVQAPGTPNREWQDLIPSVKATGIWDVYYYVEVDKNNVFVGTNQELESNQKTTGTRLQVLVERFILTIRSAPESTHVMYAAKDQDLITNSRLSTDDGTTDFSGDDLPYFEYWFEDTQTEANAVPINIQARDRGVYKIHYKLIYKDSIFNFVGNTPTEGVLTATIESRSFAEDSIRAVYDKNSGTLSVDASSYPAALQAELNDHISFQYRVYDEYNQNASWEEWSNTPLTKLTLGNYQFRVVVQNDEKGNFYAYTQAGTIKPYDQTSITEDRVVYIAMPENTYSTLAYARVWIDFTGTMLYEDAPDQFKHEGWVNSINSLFCVFRNVNSTGRNGSAVLRVQTVNSGYYFRSTDDNYLLSEYRKQNAVNWQKEEDYIYRYQGLLEIEMTVRLYEVYRVQYDANGAVLLENEVAPSDGWKWHGIDYLLKENVYKKDSDNGELLTPNGWNTTRAGNGNNYPNGSYYRENVSQIFYANFFTADDVRCQIDWIITDGVTTYALARNSGGWFNVANYDNRETGTFVPQGDIIALPQVIEDEDGNKFWSRTLFGNYYIKGWYAAQDDWTLEDGLNGNWRNFEYYLNMTATRDLTFVAILVNRSEKGVQCIFKDDQGNQINNSGLIANGAKAYMALSGMNATTIKNYSDGYKEWVEKYGNSELYTTPTGFVSYNLGTKTVVEEPTENITNTHSSGEYVAMAMILVLGSGSAIASLAVYIIKRKKHIPVNLKNLQNEVKDQKRAS